MSFYIEKVFVREIKEHQEKYAKATPGVVCSVSDHLIMSCCHDYLQSGVFLFSKYDLSA